MTPSHQKRRNNSTLSDYNEINNSHEHINPTQINSNTTNSASRSNDTIKKYNEKRALPYKIRKIKGGIDQRYKPIEN